MSNRTVLLADDDPEILQVMEFYFQQRDWKVELVQTGTKAYERILKGGIDLVVSDIRMPDGTGIGLLRRLRRSSNSLKPCPKVIIVTGLLGSGDGYLKKLGATAVFSKPVPISILLDLADQIVPPVALAA